MEDKRRHSRVTIKAMGRIFCVDDQRRFSAFIGGISRGGLEIYSGELVKKGCYLEITLDFLDKEGRLQRENIVGEVRWSAPFHESYLCGVQFNSELDEKENPILSNYLRYAESFIRNL